MMAERDVKTLPVSKQELKLRKYGMRFPEARAELSGTSGNKNQRSVCWLMGHAGLRKYSVNLYFMASATFVVAQ
jgi:hypothetical protein